MPATAAMLLPVQHLVRRLRGARSRKGEVAAAHRQLAEALREAPSAEEVSLADEMRALRPEVAAAFAEVRSCAGCARKRPLPHGRWAGGFCCGGQTSGVFTEDETAALALGGTRARDLRPPSGDHAGCAFRGAEGCSLRPEDRPNVCVRFACRELEAELREGGRWKSLRALTRRLDVAFAQFVTAREARRDRLASETPVGLPGRRAARRGPADAS